MSVSLRAMTRPPQSVSAGLPSPCPFVVFETGTGRVQHSMAASPSVARDLVNCRGTWSQLADRSARQDYLSPHHCFSQGTPSPPPSIFTPVQLARKNSASSQEDICEQYTRPSH